MIKKDLVIVGANGFGQEILWQIINSKNCKEVFNILGFVDDNPSLCGRKIHGFDVLGNDEWLLNRAEETCAVICVGSSKRRKAINNRLKANQMISFPTIIADNVYYSDRIDFGQGCIICLSSILTVNIKLGDFVIVNLDCTIGHDAVLDSYVTLHPSVNVSGGVHIHQSAEIGTGTTIIQGKSIGEGAIIGAGSVVVKDIPPNCTAVGTPAVVIKSHF